MNVDRAVMNPRWHNRDPISPPFTRGDFSFPIKIILKTIDMNSIMSNTLLWRLYDLYSRCILSFP